MDADDRAHFQQEETLRDGRKVVLRAIRADDKEGLQEGLSRMSEKSRYTRFFGPKLKISDEELRRFTELDYENHVGLVAEVIEDGEPHIVAGARYIVIEQSPRIVAEVAFGVADDFQRQGIASMMMRRLIALARDEGIDEFQALVLSQNTDMLHVFAHCGLPQSTSREGAAIALRFDLH